RTGLREMGVNFFHNNIGQPGGDRIGGMLNPSTNLSGPNSVSIPEQAVGVPNVYTRPFGDAFSLFFSGLANFPFSVVVSLLEQNALAKTLAEPTLVALSGQEAFFLAGGELPIPISTGLGAVNVQFKKFGIQLKFTPTVLGDGLVNLHLA